MWSGQHAGKVTADTAAYHTVSRQRSREWRSEGGHVKWHSGAGAVSTPRNLQIHHRPSLNIHVPRLMGSLEELLNKPCRPFRASWVELIGKVLQEKCGVGRGGDKTERKMSEHQPPSLFVLSSPIQTIIFFPNQTTSRWSRSEMNLRPCTVYSALKITKANVCGQQRWVITFLVERRSWLTNVSK